MDFLYTSNRLHALTRYFNHGGNVYLKFMPKHANLTSTIVDSICFPYSDYVFVMSNDGVHYFRYCDVTAEKYYSLVTNFFTLKTMKDLEFDKNIFVSNVVKHMLSFKIDQQYQQSQSITELLQKLPQNNNDVSKNLLNKSNETNTKDNKQQKELELESELATREYEEYEEFEESDENNKSTQITSKPELEIKMLKDTIEIWESDYDELENEYLKLTILNKEANKKINNLESEINDLELDYDHLESDYIDAKNEADEKINNLESKIDNLESELDALESNYDDLDCQYAELNEKYSDLLADQKLSKYTYNCLKADYNSDLQEMKEILIQEYEEQYDDLRKSYTNKISCLKEEYDRIIEDIRYELESTNVSFDLQTRDCLLFEIKNRCLEKQLSELTKTIAQDNQKINDLQQMLDSELDFYSQERPKYKNQIEQLQKELDNANLLNSLSEDIYSNQKLAFDNSINSMSKENKKLILQIEDIRTLYNMAISKKSELETEIENMKIQESTLNAFNKSLVKQVELFTSQVQNLKNEQNDNSNAFAELQDRYNLTCTNLADAMCKNEKADQEIIKLQSEKNEATKIAENLKEELTRLEEKSSFVSEKLTTQRNLYNCLNYNYQEKSREIDRLNSSINSLINENNSLKKSALHKDEIYRKLESTHFDLIKTTNDEKKKYDELKLENNSLIVKTNSAESELSISYRRIGKLEREIDDLKKFHAAKELYTKETSKAKIDEIEKEKQDLCSLISQKDFTIVSLKNDAGCLSSIIKQQKSDIVKQDLLIEQLKSEHAKLLEKVSYLNSEIQSRDLEKEAGIEAAKELALNIANFREEKEAEITSLKQELQKYN